MATRAYLPACVVAALGAALACVGWWSESGHRGVSQETASVRLVVFGPVSVAVIVVLLVAERVRPAQRRPFVARGHRQDALYTLLSVAAVVPLAAALAVGFSRVLRAVPWIVLPSMGVVPRWLAMVAILVTMDGCNWLAHLGNHRVRVLWRFHEVHHSQEDMSVLTVFRTHPLVHVSYLLALVPGIVLLANGALSTSLLVAYGAVLALAHSNLDLGLGPLERLVVSPNFHRIHHQLDGPQDVNLGFALTIWDQLAGRAIFPTEQTIRTDTGLPGRPLRVEQEGARPRHLAVFAAQLAGPFRPMNESTDKPPVRLESV
jgi:sterol desaturase/sphingolipid hydroxylase (fatty acid hydroxylase superfamily)